MTFALMSGIGPWTTPRVGSTADLVWALPYVVMTEIPPQHILNDLLVRGQDDAGMSGGCIWKPFEVDPEQFDELVEELRHRGPRTGRDVGDLQLEVRDVPHSVRTYEAWFWRGYTQRTGKPPPVPVDDPGAERDRAAAYTEWLEELPVGELYLGYLTKVAPDWRQMAEGDLPLPEALLGELRELERHIDMWDAARAGFAKRGPIDRVSEIVRETDKVRASLRDCVDRLDLPRWPFDRFSVCEAS
jgi:hypothetical protein